MSFSSLLNTSCNVLRRTNTNTIGEYGEPLISAPSVISANAKCRKEPLSRGQLEELGFVGEVEKAYELMYFLPSTDIQVSDRVVMVVDDGAERVVRHFGNAAGHGHHLEIIVEKIDIK